MKALHAYGRNTNVTGQVIFGGVSQHTQTQALRNGTDILVATPGRLLDLINQGYVHLDHLEMFVLDEADRMLDMGFIHDVKKIIRATAAGTPNLVFFGHHAAADLATGRQPVVKAGKGGSNTGFCLPPSALSRRYIYGASAIRKTCCVHLLQSAKILAAPLCLPAPSMVPTV